MRWTAALLALALAGCAVTPDRLANDPDVPRLTLKFDKPWLATYQAINAGVNRCESWQVKSAQDDATRSGQISVSMWERIGYLIDVRAAGEASTVTVTMPMHAEKQQRTWPDLLQKWVMEGDRTSCP